MVVNGLMERISEIRLCDDSADSINRNSRHLLVDKVKLLVGIRIDDKPLLAVVKRSIGFLETNETANLLNKQFETLMR